jgi:hypothetical protein
MQKSFLESDTTIISFKFNQFYFRNQTSQNQFYTSTITFAYSRSGTKYTR